jgi:eukaryotic-like serine/threonine-protein kinase
MTAASWYAATDEHAPPSVSGVGVSGPQKEASSVDYDSSRHRLAPGTRIGDHLIVRGVLGEGGTAVVYEALHTRLGASVALKVVDVSEEYMEGARARLLREAQVCASLEDPHVPRVYDVGELDDGTPYVVMERVSGRTLENVLSQGALPLDIAVHITEDLLHAVEAIEKAGIVHRDIKPPNIILQGSAEGTLRVRLMDFGVSKTVEAAAEPGMHSQSNPKLTQQGAIVGTPHYMAPEQIVGPSVDSRADLYAVGVVAYEMMGGRTPFEGQTTGEVVAAVLHTRPLPLRKLREVHTELEEWVEKAMAPRRADRFSSARVMREELREAWAAHQAYVQAAGRRTWARRARVVGGFGLVAVGLTLPLPAGYDLEALTKLLTGGSAAPVEPAAAAAMPGMPEQAPPTKEQPQAADMAVGVSTPSWDLNGAEAYRAPQAQQPEALAAEAALPQSEPPRGEEPANVAAPTPARTLSKGAPAMPAKIMRPQAPAPNVRAPLAGPRPIQAERAPTPPASGMLLNEYLRQLDSQLQMTPLRDLSGPAVEQGTAAPERREGEPAPNPFEPLPANPYQQPPQ